MKSGIVLYHERVLERLVDDNDHFSPVLLDRAFQCGTVFLQLILGLLDRAGHDYDGVVTIWRRQRVSISMQRK